MATFRTSVAAPKKGAFLPTSSIVTDHGSNISPSQSAFTYTPGAILTEQATNFVTANTAAAQRRAVPGAAAPAAYFQPRTSPGPRASRQLQGHAPNFGADDLLTPPASGGDAVSGPATLAIPALLVGAGVVYLLIRFSKKH